MAAPVEESVIAELACIRLAVFTLVAPVVQVSPSSQTSVAGLQPPATWQVQQPAPQASPIGSCAGPAKAWTEPPARAICARHCTTSQPTKAAGSGAEIASDEGSGTSMREQRVRGTGRAEGSVQQRSR
ncbi:MAG: hypothetical protein RIT45_675 [Pseudomonadota bacterium]